MVKDEAGNVTELRCTYVPESRSQHDTSGIKAKGTIQWVDAETGVDAEIRVTAVCSTTRNTRGRTSANA